MQVSFLKIRHKEKRYILIEKEKTHNIYKLIASNTSFAFNHATRVCPIYTKINGNYATKL